ncbi:CBS domain-containing protein [Marinomonas ostreistagni]|uniref:CBS domain-containing protein n=1 Tax=Marinomonas ostreistagni TaxID=359209 RepID=A0ABS0Z739_9GAMM|nr:CBS domain-containing protein [Marinomonas ostreistagni]MBJ7549493.1 CBS domain-containing protein [Marinomonas ostreistagni]
MKTLTYATTKDINELTWPNIEENVGLYTSALRVLTDFKTVSPRLIEPTVRADILADIMKKEHVRMKLVVDSQNHFLGVVSLEDLSDEAFVKRVAEGYVRSELLTIDLMRPKEELLAVSYKSLSNSDIESLIFSQKNNHYQHLLVVDESDMSIRGLVSANDIVRQLQLNIDVSTSTSFAKLNDILEHEYADSKRLRVA